jgi:aspartyl-tRNA(Asn)/glutamyl-tRNA(Gln) amidotransferase subunit C
MERKDIEHLARLARIRLTEKEMNNLPEELSSIISYVSTVSDITADETVESPQVGVRFNIFRQDEVTNQPNEFTKDIIAEMPSSNGRYLSVKKILNTDE